MAQTSLKKTIRSFTTAAATAASLGLTFLPSTGQAQSLGTMEAIATTYSSELKSIYRQPVGQDIIKATASGNLAQKAFSAIAIGFRDGRFEHLPYMSQYRIIGCHLSDLASVSGMLADQVHPSRANKIPGLMTYKWPFFAKIRDDSTSAYNQMRNIGYHEDCGNIRSQAYRILVLRR